jgi:hypothetical protein
MSYKDDAIRSPETDRSVSVVTNLTIFIKLSIQFDRWSNRKIILEYE